MPSTVEERSLEMQEQAGAGFWLSPQQKFAWRLQQEALHKPLRAVCLISMDGSADAARIQECLREMVSRHEILRTVFRRQAGMKVPFQVVLETAGVDWERADFSAIAAAERQSKLDALFGTEQKREFNLESAPVLRAVFVALDENASALILSVPTLCADARSFEILAREVEMLYSGQRDNLAEPFRYVQFAQWQADLIESEEADAKQGREFWDARPTRIAFALPFEKKSEQAAFQPESVAVRVGDRPAAAILARTDGSLVLLTALECMLHRLSGQTAFSVGFSSDSREYEELENAIGGLGRTFPLQARIENDFSFSDVLRQTGNDLREAVAVQEYFAPEAIGLDGELISFAYCDLGGKQSLGGVTFGLERGWVVSERFKLRLAVVQRGESLELEFQYDASRLDRGAIERIAGYYQNLLAAGVANPATAVAKLPLLSEDDRRQLLVEWNQTAAAYPSEKCLHELFEQQAARVPDRIAVRCGEIAFSYRELNERANQLAHYLRGLGVGPDRPVGLCLERSAETMVAVLAILKAGGAYVPLNPDNPPARLLQQLHGAAAVITEARLSAQMPEFAGSIVVLDRDQQLWAKESKANPASNTSPENLVYVIYTSGSTGVPKGVAVRHRNLVNYADFIAKRLELEKYSEGLQFATVSTLGADLGNTCIYPSLISGGTLHIIGYEMATDPRNFAEYVTKYPIDVLKIVPSHLQALVQSDDAAKLLPRKYLIFGGETLTPKILEKVEALNPSCEILNHYGPTETTVGSLTLKLKDYDWKSAQLASIPIGRPIQNTQVYILDANLEPAPVGVIGELYIAGAGVTAGYLGQAEKTAERFVKNPFATDSKSADGTNSASEFGKTMYRTGDLARYGADGNIEFLGRGDDQVKIRGFRIELGEIEAVLARHAGVKQAVVLAREDSQGEKRLLAYVVAQRGAASSTGAGSSAGSSAAAEITGETLRGYLKQELPDYMVPQAVMVLQKLPLNTNGKIDRQALPEPEQLTAARTYVAPRTATEIAIAEIWAEVLRRKPDQISVDDNFFDLGGHSLLATQVISRIRERFSVEIPMRAMFDQPLVSGLAKAVEEAEPVSASGGDDDMGIARVAREAYKA
jgi:amino acid adenylation domain-containing protein